MTTCIRREHTRWTTCDCPDCMIDRRRVAKRARTGYLERTPSAAAWAALDEWVEAGFSSTWIASAAGIPARGIQSAVEEHRTTGRRRDFGHNRAHAIVEADITTATTGRRDATGTRRRLQALAVNGWTCEALSAECGISFVTLASIRRGQSKQIGARHWHTIRELYDRLENVPGGNADATRRALNQGWYAPAQWDTPDTDPEPLKTRELRREAPLDYVAIRRRIEGDKTVHLTQRERVEALRQWLDQDPSDIRTRSSSGSAVDRLDLGSISEFERRTGIARANRYKRAAMAAQEAAA